MSDLSWGDNPRDPALVLNAQPTDHPLVLARRYLENQYPGIRLISFEAPPWNIQEVPAWVDRFRREMEKIFITEHKSKTLQPLTIPLAAFGDAITHQDMRGMTNAGVFVVDRKSPRQTDITTPADLMVYIAARRKALEQTQASQVLDPQKVLLNAQ